jgi:hypothetical protein
LYVDGVEFATYRKRERWKIGLLLNSKKSALGGFSISSGAV